MIGYIKGIIVEKHQDGIVIDHNGMGFNVSCPLSVIEVLPSEGQECKIYTYMYVREDQMGLFGFESKQQLDMFKQLITVNGVGPKAGMSILSTLSVSALMMAIVSQDAKAISKAPGVGPKAAQKIIIDLKDKVAAEDILYQEVSQATDAIATGDASAKTEAIMALVSLGYDQASASKAVNKVEITPEMNVDDILKLALKNVF